MRIVPYDKKYRDEFIRLNFEWIDKMFKIELIDVQDLARIDDNIAAGGQIYLAVNDQDEVMACCEISPIGDKWEIQKFAANPKYKGQGAGKAVLKACLDYAKKNNYHDLILITNTKCEAAIHLYKEFGFKQVPINKEMFPFKRANVQMELTI